MNKEQREKIHKLLDLCFDVKTKGHDVFLIYSPHVNKIDIDCYLFGWKEKTKSDHYDAIYLERDNSDYKLDKAIVYLTNLLNKDNDKQTQLDIFKVNYENIKKCDDVNYRDLYLTGLLSDMEKTYSIPALNDEHYNAANPDIIDLYRAIGNERSFIKNLTSS